MRRQSSGTRPGAERNQSTIGTPRLWTTLATKPTITMSRTFSPSRRGATAPYGGQMAAHSPQRKVEPDHEQHGRRPHVAEILVAGNGHRHRPQQGRHVIARPRTERPLEERDDRDQTRGSRALRASHGGVQRNRNRKPHAHADPRRIRSVGVGRAQRDECRRHRDKQPTRRMKIVKRSTHGRLAATAASRSVLLAAAGSSHRRRSRPRFPFPRRQSPPAPYPRQQPPANRQQRERPPLRPFGGWTPGQSGSFRSDCVTPRHCLPDTCSPSLLRRSSRDAQPTASVTTAGLPLAIASLTTRPQVSRRSDGSTSTSAEA